MILEQRRYLEASGFQLKYVVSLKIEKGTLRILPKLFTFTSNVPL